MLICSMCFSIRVGSVVQGRLKVEIYKTFLQGTVVTKNFTAELRTSGRTA